MKKLEGFKIVVTRHPEAAQKTARLIEELGGEPIIIPFIQITPLSDLLPLDRRLKELSSYDWLLFTSRNAVTVTLDRMEALGLPLDELARVRVAAVGTGTAQALEERGIKVALIPSRFRWQELAQEMAWQGPGTRILFPRGNLAKVELPVAMRQSGLEVDAVTVYETRPDPGVAAQLNILSRQGGAHAIMLTSDSTAIALARALVKLEQPDLGFLRPPGANPDQPLPLIACIGPNTARVARDHGLPVHVVAPVARVEALIEAVAQALSLGTGDPPAP